MSAEHLGHAAALGCAALWALSTVLFGGAAKSVDPRALNLLKCALAALLLTATSVALGDIPSFSTRDTIALVISAVCGIVLADTGYFVALKHLGAARGVLFVALVPVCTSLLAVPMLDEPLTLQMLSGMVLTLVGVVLVVRTRVPPVEARADAVGARPDAVGARADSVGARADVVGARADAVGARASVPASAVGVAGGVVYCVAQAFANVLTKSADPSLSPLALSSFRLSIGAVILLTSLVVTAGGRAKILALRPVLARGSLATLGGAYAGLLLGTFALRTVSAGVATTLIATTPLFALVAARVIDKEKPNARTLLGAILALGGVALLVL